MYFNLLKILGSAIYLEGDMEYDLVQSCNVSLCHCLAADGIFDLLYSLKF